MRTIKIFAVAAVLALTMVAFGQGGVRAADELDLFRPVNDHDSAVDAHDYDLPVVRNEGAGAYGQLEREDALEMSKPELGHNSYPVWDETPRGEGERINRDEALHRAKPQSDWMTDDLVE